MRKLIKKLVDWFEDLLWSRAIKDVFENPEYYEEEIKMRKKVSNELTLEGFEQADLVSVLREYLDTHTYHDGDNGKFLTVKRVYDFIIDNNGATELTISHNTDYNVGG